MCSANFTTIYSAASWPTGFFVWDVIPARKRSCWPSAVSEGPFALRVGPAYGPDRSTPGRVRRALGADAPMGGVRAHSVALLDHALAGADRTGARRTGGISWSA